MSEATPSLDLLRLTARIVAAHAAHNSVAGDALPDLIRTVHAALENAAAVPDCGVLQPTVPARELVFPDYIVCLEDGKRLKMLKRHLFTSYKMTPQQDPAEVGSPGQLPHGGSQLCRLPFDAGQGHWAWPVPPLARRRPLSALSSDPEPGPVPVQRVPEGVRGKRVPRTAAV